MCKWVAIKLAGILSQFRCFVSRSTQQQARNQFNRIAQKKRWPLVIREGVKKQTRSKQGYSSYSRTGWDPKQGYSNSVTAGQDRPEARCHFSETSRGGADTAKASLHHRSPFPSLSSFSDKGSALRTSHSVFFISLILHFWGWQGLFKPSFFDWYFSERWHIWLFSHGSPKFLNWPLRPDQMELFFTQFWQFIHIAKDQNRSTYIWSVWHSG